MSNDFNDKLMREIESGAVHMKPRWHFVARGMLAVAALLLEAALAIAVTGFIALLLQASGLLRLPAFGWVGFVLFVAHFPWLLTGVLLALIVTFDYLARRNSWAYRYPALVTMAVLSLGVLTVGAAIGNYAHGTCPNRGSAVGAALDRFRQWAAAAPPMLHVGEIAAGERGTENGRRVIRVMTSDGEFRAFVTPALEELIGPAAVPGARVMILGAADGRTIEVRGLRVMAPPGEPPASVAGCPVRSFRYRPVKTLQPRPGVIPGQFGE
jgi:hypothetical protein